MKLMTSQSRPIGHLGLLIWAVGGVLAIVSIALTWVTIRATLVDGSVSEVVMSGMDLVTAGAGSWSLVPVLVAAFAVASIALLVKNVVRPGMSVRAEAMVLPIMTVVLLLCFINMDGVLAFTDPPDGFLSDEMPSWVPPLIDGRIDYALVSCETSRYMGPGGMLVSWIGSIVYGYGLRRTL